MDKTSQEPEANKNAQSSHSVSQRRRYKKYSLHNLGLVRSLHSVSMPDITKVHCQTDNRNACAIRLMPERDTTGHGLCRPNEHVQYPNNSQVSSKVASLENLTEFQDQEINKAKGQSYQRVYGRRKAETLSRMSWEARQILTDIKSNNHSVDNVPLSRLHDTTPPTCASSGVEHNRTSAVVSDFDDGLFLRTQAQDTVREWESQKRVDRMEHSKKNANNASHDCLLNKTSAQLGHRNQLPRVLHKIPRISPGFQITFPNYDARYCEILRDQGASPDPQVRDKAVEKCRKWLEKCGNVAHRKTDIDK